MSKQNKLFYFGILPGLIIQLIGAYLYFVLLADKPYAQGLYFGVKVSILVWPLIWWLAYRKVLLEWEGKNLRQSLKWGFCSGMAILILTITLYFLFEDFFLGFKENIFEKAKELNFLEHYILFAFFLSVIHSLLEEYYWRWFIFRGLMIKLNPIWAGLIGSLGFASHHYIILGAFFPLWLTLILGTAVAIGGGFWCFIYRRTKSIYGSWISHFFVDVAIMTVGYFILT